MGRAQDQEMPCLPFFKDTAIPNSAVCGRPDGRGGGSGRITRRPAGQAAWASSTRAATTSPRRTTRSGPPCGSRPAEPEFFPRNKIRQHSGRRQNDVLPPPVFIAAGLRFSAQSWEIWS